MKRELANQEDKIYLRSINQFFSFNGCVFVTLQSRECIQNCVSWEPGIFTLKILGWNIQLQKLQHYNFKNKISTWRVSIREGRKRAFLMHLCWGKRRKWYSYQEAKSNSNKSCYDKPHALVWFSRNCTAVNKTVMARKQKFYRIRHHLL